MATLTAALDHTAATVAIPHAAGACSPRRRRAALATVFMLASGLTLAPASRALDISSDRADGKVAAASDFTFNRRVLSSELPVLVEFWAPWCLPCQRNEEPLAAVAREYAGRARVVRVNVNWSPLHTRRYGVAVLPTVAVFSAGQLVTRSTGISSARDLAELLAGVVPATKTARAPEAGTLPAATESARATVPGAR